MKKKPEYETLKQIIAEDKRKKTNKLLPNLELFRDPENLPVMKKALLNYYPIAGK